jgi:hypothetical protein
MIVASRENGLAYGGPESTLSGAAQVAREKTAAARRNWVHFLGWRY